MNKLFIALKNTLVLSLFIACFAVFAQAQQQIPAEVKAVVGTYTGTWTAFTINDKGEIIKQMSWTDVMKAENPVVEKDRAYVSTVDEMSFDGGRIPPMKAPGKEGYMLNKDGSLGDYFIEMFGQTIKMNRLDKDVYVYTVPANPREFAALGDKFISASHVLVKNVVVAEGVETHHISRLTTVRWKDAEGKERAMQFVSLQGQHKRSLGK